MNIFPFITYTYTNRHNRFLLPLPARAICAGSCKIESSISNVLDNKKETVNQFLEPISGALPERIITERLGILMRVLFHQQPCIPAETDSIIDGPKLTLQEELAKSRFALEIAYSNFDNVTDPDLIDCYIYEVNAVMKRYKYLLEQAAEMDVLTESKPGEAYRALSLFS